ncbi:MAG: endonuclease domain-containing protein, partial [Chloroflexota bacterium]
VLNLWMTSLSPTPPPGGRGLDSVIYIILGFNMGLNKKVIERDMYFGAKTEMFELALRMRKNPTDAEQAMWKILRNYRHSGFLFRRQHPIEFYVADFYCHKLRLVIEVDGEIHEDEEIQIHDDGRTGEMERFGIKVIRFTNDQVLNDPKSISDQINSLIIKMVVS